MVIPKTSSRTREQKEQKKQREKDPRRAQLEAKLVNPVSLTLFFIILVVSIVIGVVLGATTEVQDWVVAAVITGGSLIGFYFMFALKIADSFRQASLAYVDNPTALHLRATNMLFEGLQERGALIIVPSSAVDTMNLGGLAGLTALAQNAQTMISKTNSDSPNPEDEK